MALTFLLDGQLFDPPKGWEGTSFARTFDHNTQITTLDYSQQYTFTGAAYAYLYAKAVGGQECDLVDVLITDGARTLVQGVIFITDCTFHEKRCAVDVKVEDDGFSARIENNLSIPAEIGVPSSKNGTAISAPTPVIVRMFDQNTGGPLVGSSDRAVYRVHDAMKWFVEWMTDGIVLFRSDFFNVGGIGYADTVTSGINLRSENANIEAGPLITFRDLFTTWRIIRNVGMGFEWVNGVPQVRVEHIEFFRTGTTVIPIADIKDVELSFVRELLYSIVEVGSETTDSGECNAGCGAFVNVRYFGFQNDTFGLTGTCNRDIPLNLNMPRGVIVDGNTIQSILVDNDDSYNDAMVCINIDPSTNIAPSSDPLNIGQYWYNGEYTNENILLRYVDYINGNIGFFQLIENLNLFLCSGSSPFGRMQPSINYAPVLDEAPIWTLYPVGGPNMVFFNDTAFVQAPGSVVPRIQAGMQSFDVGGRYNDTNGRYDCEYNGAFRFQMQFGVDAQSGSPQGQVNVRCSAIRHDAGGTVIQTTTIPLLTDNTINLTVPQATPIWDSGFIEGDAGDYFTFTLEANTTSPSTSPVTFQVLDGWIELVESRSVVETTQTNTASKRLGVRRSFEYPLPCEKADSIREDITARIQLLSGDLIKTGVIERVEVNMVSGKSSFDIITNV
jgi:hypothetical protein